ncbi:MAG TPA: peptidylprolyl isomerase [Vicinamibacterales bacterium]|jgi:cyclophilin family peptidyl-prolyl cis-trans isomerase
MTSVRRLLTAWIIASATLAAQTAPPPVIVFETTKGSFAVETYPSEAPKTVAHIVELVKQGFYDGQRIHRAVPDFLVQWGDPRSRDLSEESSWGRGAAASSGHPIGAAEITKRRTNTAGAVGVSHQGLPSQADSQIYVTLAARPDLDGKYAVFGHVIEGVDVPARLVRGDVITKAFVRE